MKVEIREDQNKKEVYPILMTNKKMEGSVVLMTRSIGNYSLEGLVIKHPNLEVGYIGTVFIKDIWTPFEGEVVLRNK